MTSDWVKHQLFIHLDYHPDGKLEVHYHYPLSAPPIPEQTVTLRESAVQNKLKGDLDFVKECLIERIPPKSIRTPSAEIRPSIIPKITTIIIQDQTRSNEVPLARLYYLETVEEIGLQVEKQIEMNRSHFVGDKRLAWERIRAKAKGIAWQDYKCKLGRYFRENQMGQ